MRGPLREKAKALALGSMISTLSLIITIGAGEVSYRLYHHLRYGVPFFSIPEHLVKLHPPVTRDDYLGWHATPNYRSIETRDKRDGKPSTITITQNEYGFRLFGDLRTANPKIMVIGDSFTQALDVSDDQTYYSIVQDVLNVEIFAYGVSAYGTLQEYMILDKYIGQIQPSLIVWQYCFNDFQDNIPELATEIFTDYHGMVRPYWVHGHVEYIPTRSYVRHIRRFALLYSRLFFLLSRKLDTILIRHLTPDEMTRHPAFPRAVQVTDELMQKVRSRVGDIPVLAFSCDDGPQYVKAFKEISRHHGIMFLEDVAGSVKRAEDNGTMVRAGAYPHLNEMGHRIVAGVIADYLKRNVLRSGSEPHRE